MICHDCNIDMNFRRFHTREVWWCPECFDYTIQDIPCEHEYELMLFDLANGSRQLREYCQKCHDITKNILKQSGRDLTGIRIKSNDSYNAFISERLRKEQEHVSELTEELRRKQYDRHYFAYLQYINSDDWRKIRSRIMTRDGGVCQICGGPAHHVHHLTYAHFRREFPFELVALCESCHKKEYHSPDVKKKVSELRIPEP